MYDYEKRSLCILEEGNEVRVINRYHILPFPLLEQIQEITSLHQYFSEALDEYDFKIRYGKWNYKSIQGKGYQIENVNWNSPIYILEEDLNFVLRKNKGDTVVYCWDARVSFYLAAIYTMADKDEDEFQKLLISDLKNYQHLG